MIRGQLDWLESHTAPGGDVIVYGPRGNGKTVLMGWALKEARARGIEAINFSSKEIRSTEWLARHLSPVPRWLSAFRGFSALVFGIQTRESTMGRLRDALARRTRRRALLVAVDEAQTLSVEAGQDLLHAVQLLGLEELPVMLLLAGTPDLSRHLNSMDASFWGRSKILSLGLLKPDPAADAIRIPLEAKSRSIAADALAQVVEESHGYPFFVQMWGELLWKATSDDARPISLEDVDLIRPRFKRARNEYYHQRYQELIRAELAFVAAMLSVAFSDAGSRTRGEFHDAVRQALVRERRAADSDAVMQACDRLFDLGYVWSVSDETGQQYEAGIPSLMRYVLRCEGLDVGSEAS